MSSLIFIASLAPPIFRIQKNLHHRPIRIVYIKPLSKSNSLAISLSLSRHHINFIFYYNALCIRTRELLDAYFEKSYNNQTLSLSFKVCLVKDSLKLIIDKLIKDTSLKVKKDPYCDRRNIFVKCWCVK